MKAPDKIYMLPEVASTVKVLDEEVEYIRKDALLKWAQEKNKRIDSDDGDYSLGYVSAMIDLIDKLKSM